MSMEESHKIDDLIAAREILKSSIEKSRDIAIAVDETGSRLKEKTHNLAYLQAATKNMACKLAVYEIRDHIDRAIGPAAAVLNASWTWFTSCKIRSRQILVLLELQGKGESGVLSSAFHKLEREYMHLLTENSFPEPVIQELQSITEVLAANDRLDRCVSIYTQVRIENVRANVQALNLEYLDIQLSEIVSVQTLEGYIDQWDKHMEFAVRHLLQKEHRLCSEVYRIGSSSDDVWMNCFAKIATQCGFTDIFDFGTKICKCKKEAIKLLRLLKIFSTLDRLRLEFNHLFDGKFCVEIQNQTRHLVRKVVDGACEIFWELVVQVEMQRASSPPPDGSIPRLVRFVTDYCNQLLEDENSSILVRVLEIHNNQVEPEEGPGPGRNQAWRLNGESWLWAYEESTEYYAALYMRESWEKLLVLLSEEDIILFPGGRAVDRNLVKKRICSFCDAFDDMYKKQSNWILCDKALRWKTCQRIVEAIVRLIRAANALDLIRIKNAAVVNHYSSSPAAA
ncbi:hypothetical protein DH2020_038159 [Rehmannia glutinosa]|uniref:Exocyst subunit Exo70 family protein n=1 Tax=Rehmannia glutinosa TaxID=99300 RepID=A0ABR0UZE5_REHGL